MVNDDLLAALAAYEIADGSERELAKTRILEILDGISGEKAKEKPLPVETRINSILVELGVPNSLKGYDLLAYAIKIVVESPDIVHAITKKIYPELANRFHNTPSRVERAIRHAIEVAIDRSDYETICRYFGNTISPSKGKPTNKEFIARLADVVRNEL